MVTSGKKSNIETFACTPTGTGCSSIVALYEQPG